MNQSEVDKYVEDVSKNVISSLSVTDYPDIAQYLLLALVKIKNYIEANRGLNINKGIIDNLNNTIFLVRKIRKAREPKKIGFFGAQKRGKSSLINLLLGVDLLPTGARPMTSVGIDIRHDTKHPVDQYSIDVISTDGAVDPHKELPLSSAKDILERFGSSKGNSDHIVQISVVSNFCKSEILRGGGVLLDTPGAELAFDTEQNNNSNKQDLSRAIDLLESTHIVIFVERADLMQSQNSKTFFSKYLKEMRPLCVINMKDKFALDDRQQPKDPELIETAKQAQLKRILLNTYPANMDRVLCLSCKEALDNKKKSISGLESLKERISYEFRNLSPEVGLKTCLEELQKNFKQIQSMTDQDTAREIFLAARAAFAVFLENIPKTNAMEEVHKLAQAIDRSYPRK